MTRFAIHHARGHTDRLPVALYVRNDDRAAKLVITGDWNDDNNRRVLCHVILKFYRHNELKIGRQFAGASTTVNAPEKNFPALLTFPGKA